MVHLDVVWKRDPWRFFRKNLHLFCMGKITACWIENGMVLFLLELFLKQDTGKQWSLKHNNGPQINPHTQCVCRSLFWWWDSKDLWQAFFCCTSPPPERSCVQGVCVWVCFQRPWIMIRAVGRVSTKSSTHNAKRNYHRETWRTSQHTISIIFKWHQGHLRKAVVLLYFALDHRLL